MSRKGATALAEGTGKATLLRVGYGLGMILGLAGVFLLDFLSGKNVASTLALVATGGLGCWEVYALCERKGLRPWKVTGAAAGGLLFVAQWLDAEIAPGEGMPVTVAFCLGVLFLLALLALLRRAGRATVIEDLSVTIFGLFYVGFLLSFTFQLRNDPDLPGTAGLWLTLLFLGTSKIGDIAAFFTGSLVGKRRLAPPISPNKTLEGSLGGLLASIGFALLFCPAIPALRFLPAVPFALAFGVTVGVLSQTGDLFESLLKRSVHAKDSGALVPEFGGVLDLIDGLLFSGPAAWFLVLLFR